ncbi:alkane 1-monooxygenase [Hasllibacter halocynthiae]|uniref:Alkane 1-monooxygenase n=1 Tax=Hasllibacter halocynthiae TaxID=595589 RepID=A0A2T0X1I6_9RHOB|nr:alkane 1-monooxygenase [Hasllibacter halocynthiae]PRY92801.1 alkane 1-monooxygenase [Hasllibacter halocynthiae]
MAVTTNDTGGVRPVGGFAKAMPFWLCLMNVPLVVIAATQGGWTVILPALYAWGAFSVMDALAGLSEENPDPLTPDSELTWYRAITLIWPVVQIGLIFGTLAYLTATDHLAWWEEILVFFGIGVASGTIGIVYAHELMHQKPKVERWMGDVLMASTLYSHFRSEHLLVHHRYVCTPRDPVTARYNEGFHRFFPRVVRQSLASSWKAEAAMLERRGKSRFDRKNPFWRYAALQGAMLLAALLISGWWGVLLFAYQAFVAIWQLELVNYIEHYGLTRKHLGAGKYEHVLPRHSWNAAHRASNWLLINLQRHSDHHYKPDRRFPLLQTYPEDEAPQLPYGYPVMTAMAMVPPLFLRFMNPRVRAWRRRHYPEIDDWGPYRWMTNPMPR